MSSTRSLARDIARAEYAIEQQKQTTPNPAAAAALGLRTFAADLEASGDPDAVTLAGPLPMGLDDWAEYPTNPYRLVVFPHLRTLPTENPAA
jgi:hypothetical protein